MTAGRPPVDKFNNSQLGNGAYYDGRSATARRFREVLAV